MAARGIYPNSFKYYEPNAAQDIQENKPYIFLGSFEAHPSRWDLDQTYIQALIVKTNMEAKTTLHVLGSPQIYTPSNSHRWQILKITFQVIFKGLYSGSKPTLYYFIYTSLLIITPCLILYIYIRTIVPLIDAGFHKAAFLKACPLLGSGLTGMYMLHVKSEPVINEFRSTIENAQQSCFDHYLAFQPHSEIPNSMEGFNADDLANNKTDEGWIDPLTFEPIPFNEISSSKILRIGNYSSPIIDAIKAMLSYNPVRHASGEIPNLFQNRILTAEEKTKFLNETSAFFGIIDPLELEACWKVNVEDEDVQSQINRVDNDDWNRLSKEQKNQFYRLIQRELIPIKQKQAFLSLLPYAVKMAHFDKQFRSDEVDLSRIVHIDP